MPCGTKSNTFILDAPSGNGRNDDDTQNATTGESGVCFLLSRGTHDLTRSEPPQGLRRAQQRNNPLHPHRTALRYSAHGNRGVAPLCRAISRSARSKRVIDGMPPINGSDASSLAAADKLDEELSNARAILEGLASALKLDPGAA